MSDVNTSVSDEEVEAQRQRVEELRMQALAAEQEAAARLSGADNATTLNTLKLEELRLTEEIATANAVGVVPEGGWPKPESPTEYVQPMGTLSEVPPEATPTYLPSPGGEEPSGSTVTTTSTPQAPSLLSQPQPQPLPGQPVTPLTTENQE